MTNSLLACSPQRELVMAQVGSLSIAIEHRTDPPTTVAAPGSEWHGLCLFLGGTARSLALRDTLGARLVGLAPGSLKIEPANCPQWMSWNGEAETLRVRLSPVALDATAADVIGGRAGPMALTPCEMAGDPIVERILLGLLDEAQSSGPGGQLCMESLEQLLHVQLLRRYARADPAAVVQGTSLSARQVRRVVEFIEARLEEPLTLNDLARAAGVSRSRLACGFRRSTGHTPHAYLVWQRIGRAQAALISGDETILAIAVRCGFESASHFAATFRRIVGITPSDFRKRSRR